MKMILDAYKTKKQIEIQREQQRLSIKLFAFFNILGSISGAIIINDYPFLTSSEVRLYVIFIVIFEAIVLPTLFLCNSKKADRHLELVDLILFIINLLTYILIITTSPKLKVINAAFWLPLLVLVSLSLRNKLYNTLFLFFHVVCLIYYRFTLTVYEYSVTPALFSNLIVTAILVIFISRALINKSRKYEEIILEDYEELQGSYFELSSLNEKYQNSQKELQDKMLEILRLAYYDSLTNILDRNGLRVQLDEYLSSGKEGYLVLIDIRGFSQINNVYGFEFGDHILKKVANNISDVKLNSIMTARFRDDIFAVVVDDSREGLDVISELQNLPSMIESNDIAINLSYVFGMVQFEGKSNIEEELISSAEIALKDAKKQLHTNYQIFTTKLLQQVEHQVTLYYDLEKAIESREIFLNYQPIYNTSTEKLYGFEALARWEHELLGRINPDIFIAIAEQSVLIHSLGSGIANEVIDNISWLPRVSINVSAKELTRENFADKFLHRLRNRKVDVSKIGIEVTETGIIDNIDVAMKNLNTLKKGGITIYLDDFGTGFSSLSYLTQLPIDILKIDRHFIFNLIDSKKDQALLKGIVQLAKSLTIKTLAEGVETRETFEIIKELEIDYVQGYYFSKPLTEREAEDLTVSNGDYTI